MISVPSLIAGLAVLAGIVGCVMGTAWLITTRRLPDLRGTERALALALTATGMLLAVHLLPGALGILDRWSVLATSVLALAAASRISPTRSAGPAPAAPGGSAGHSGPASRLIAVAGIAVVAGYELAYLRHHYAAAPVGIDALSFHLPDVARWIQSGSFWEVDQFLPQLAQGNYPNNGDLVFLALVLPIKSALLVRWAMVPYLLLTCAAVYALGRELGAPRDSALLFGGAVAAVPAVAAPALVDTQTDTLMLFGFAAGALFLLRHRRTAARGDLVLAGLGLGIAFGTKWYGVTCVAALVFVWALAQLVGRRSVRVLGSQLAGLVAMILLAGGFWLLRNLVESADPFFPARVRILGVTIFDAPPDVLRETAGFTVAHYLGQPHVLRAFILPALLQTLAWLSLLLGACAVAAAAWVTAGSYRGRSRPRSGSRPPATQGAVAMVAAAALLVAAVYTITPETALGPRGLPVQTNANTRYLVPALVLAAPLAAWLAGRLGRFGVLLELACLALVVEALSRVFSLHSWLAGAVAVAIFALVVGVRTRTSEWWSVRLSTWRPRRSVIAVPVLAVAGVAGLALATRRAYDDGPYRADAAIAWLLGRAGAGHRVGLAGVWSNGLAPIFPSFGPRLENRVAYVGPFVRHMLQQYQAPGPFQSALHAGRYDLVIVGTGFPRPLPSVPTQAWVRAAGYHEVVRSARLVLYARYTHG